MKSNSETLDQWLVRHTICLGDFVGLDVGGANLKLVWLSTKNSSIQIRRSRSLPFALWKEPGHLPSALNALLEGVPKQAAITVTMTGEIADCFASKQAGVETIVNACELAGENFEQSVCYYSQPLENENDLLAPRFLRADQAKLNTLAVAASNWHAVANLIGSYLTSREQNSGLVLDLGSTTLDLTPVDSESRSIPTKTDWQRLCDGNLVYSGVGRSPLACLLPEYGEEPEKIRLAQELFATARDAYLLTDDESEDENCFNTADGRPATKLAANQRIARMLCSDHSELPVGLATEIAFAAKTNQMSIFRAAIERQIQGLVDCHWIAICGQGEKVLSQVVSQHFPTQHCIKLSELHGDGCSLAAPAFAVAAFRSCRK